MPGRERRRWVRVEPRGRLQASLGGSSSAQVLNLAPTGAMVEHTTRLAPGEIRTLSLRIAELDLHVHARVAWTQIYSTTRRLPGQGQLRFRSGLTFLPLPEKAEADLRKYIDTLTSRRPHPAREAE